MPKILADENLSIKLVVKLGHVFEEVSHVAKHGLSTGEDHVIWQFAKESGYIILTKDNDYRFMSVISGCPPKVIQLRCGNRSTDYVVDLIKIHVNGIVRFAESDECYMEIL